jgi:hypothetical protein
MSTSFWNNTLATALKDKDMTLNDVVKHIDDYRTANPGIFLRDILLYTSGDDGTEMYIHLASNHHPDVIQFVIDRAARPDIREGLAFSEAVCALNSNPAVIDVLRDNTFDFSSNDQMHFKSLFHMACLTQQHPEVVKRIFEVTLDQTGKSVLDILSVQVNVMGIDVTALQMAARGPADPTVMIQVLELYPDETMRLEKYQETKELLEKRIQEVQSYQGLSDDERQEQLQRLRSKLQLVDDVIMTTTTEENEERHESKANMFPWTIFFIIMCLLLICGGALYVVM